MTYRILFQSLACAAAILSLVSGCATREESASQSGSGLIASGNMVGAETEVPEAPPKALAEQENYASPGNVVWIAGVWAWHGDRWIWETGHWAHIPSPGSVWTPHRYYERDGHHYFVRGGWR